MSRVPSDRHGASWTALCPGNNESAGKRRSGKTPQRQPASARRAGRGGNAAIRSKNTYLRAQYERAKTPPWAQQGIVAVAQSILIAASSSGSNTP